MIQYIYSLVNIKLPKK